MNNLNKENFFNQAFEKYPKAAEKFNDWIDDYKCEIDWKNVFRRKPYSHEVYKFHEIPFDLQKGILLRFLCEVYPDSVQQYVDSIQLAAILDRSLKVINDL